MEGGAFEASGVGVVLSRMGKWEVSEGGTNGENRQTGSTGCWRMLLLAGEMCILRQRHWVIPEGGKPGVHEQSNKMPGPGG